MSLSKSLCVIDALMHEPRTIFDLVVACDIHEDTAREYVRILRDAGRLEFDGFGQAVGRGTRPSRWRWVAATNFAVLEPA